jgi:hypothetical protein
MPGIGRRSPNFDRDEGGPEIPATVEGLEMADGRVWRTVGEERRDIFEGIPLPSLGSGRTPGSGGHLCGGISLFFFCRTPCWWCWSRGRRSR